MPIRTWTTRWRSRFHWTLKHVRLILISQSLRINGIGICKEVIIELSTSLYKCFLRNLFAFAISNKTLLMENLLTFNKPSIWHRSHLHGFVIINSALVLTAFKSLLWTFLLVLGWILFMKHQLLELWLTILWVFWPESLIDAQWYGLPIIFHYWLWFLVKHNIVVFEFSHYGITFEISIFLHVVKIKNLRFWYLKRLIFFNSSNICVLFHATFGPGLFTTQCLYLKFHIDCYFICLLIY